MKYRWLSNYYTGQLKDYDLNVGDIDSESIFLFNIQHIFNIYTNTYTASKRSGRDQLGYRFGYYEQV